MASWGKTDLEPDADDNTNSHEDFPIIHEDTEEIALAEKNAVGIDGETEQKQTDSAGDIIAANNGEATLLSKIEETAKNQLHKNSLV